MTDVLAVREEYRRQEWAEIIREGQASGLTKREYCQQRGITERQYYYWLKKLRETLVEQMQPQVVSLEGGKSGRRDMIQVQFGEALVKVPAETDAGAIAQLLRALQSLC